MPPCSWRSRPSCSSTSRLLIGYAFSWVFALIGLTASSPEAADAYSFTILFPLTFVSSAFVPVESMPAWLRPVAENNPVWLTVVWSVGIAVVAATLAVWRYRSVVAG